MYAHSCVDQGCTAVVIGSRAGVPDWIVWNCKDKYRKAGFFKASSPVDGVDNACRFARPCAGLIPAAFRNMADPIACYRGPGLFAVRAWLVLRAPLHPVVPLAMSGPGAACPRHDDRPHLRPVAAAMVVCIAASPVRAYTPSSSPLPRMSLYFRRPGKAAWNGPWVAE